jgi:hypothetical protein
MNKGKNILTTAPFLADSFIDLDKRIFDTDKYSDFLKKNEIRLGIFKKYLICKLHDSSIIDISQYNDKLTIILNDIATYEFASAIVDKFKLSIDLDNISFPIKIEFIDNLLVDYYKVDDKGKLNKIDPIRLDEYLYEQVTNISDDKIEIVFHFWNSNLTQNKPGEPIILIVSANKLKIAENQDKSWKDLFGDMYNDFYKYFKEQFNNNRYVSDYHECVKLIDEFEQNIK